MYIITFYSFKGGVGRTMGLVNVGAELALMGRKVLLVDFDLEAPGLETYGPLRPASPPPRRESRWSSLNKMGTGIVVSNRQQYRVPSLPGLVEYVTEYMRTKRAPDVREYVYWVGGMGSNKQGSMWIMPAGVRDAQYQAALASIDWQALYRDGNGFLLFEDLKAQWEREIKPDYVLIDSRTGHTDVEGICTRQLPDAVVVFFIPNEQNLVGLQVVCKRIENELNCGLMKDIHLHFVASNVPILNDEDRELRRHLKVFEEELDFDEPDGIIHRFESKMLFNQSIVVLDKPKSQLAREYRKLARQLIVYNPADRDGALPYLRSLNAHLNNFNEPSARRLWALGSYNPDPDRISENFPEDSEIQKEVNLWREVVKKTKEQSEQAKSTSPPPPETDRVTDSRSGTQRRKRVRKR